MGRGKEVLGDCFRVHALLCKVLAIICIVISVVCIIAGAVLVAKNTYNALDIDGDVEEWDDRHQ